MRRQAWWGGLVAALSLSLSCAGTGNVEPVVEEAPLPPQDVEAPTASVTPAPTDEAHPIQLPEQFYAFPPRTEAMPPVQTENLDEPLPTQTIVPPSLPAETATPVVKGSAGWTFLTSANGLPPRIFGASADEAGNLWVAGGNSGVFVRRVGQTRFQQISTPAPAISIAGGAAGIAYVGYMGLNNCDMSWDTGGTAGVYKSGDADRLVLNGSSVSRQHYDIYSGPGVVAAEPRGREKLCNIFRIAYDAKTRSVWFGGNHGVAWGDADSTRVVEHTHPSINGYMRNAQTGQLHYTMISGDYMGLAVTPNGDLWIGGRERSALFPYAQQGNDFWKADVAIQSTKLDVWPDAVPQDPNPEQAVWDDTHGFAPLLDGKAWVGSSTKGVALLGPDQKVLGHYLAPLIDRSVTAMATDPLNGSMWAGHGGVLRKGGLTRVVGTSFEHHSANALGNWAKSRVYDIQAQKVGPNGKRRMIVAFWNGAVGLYDGD